ncbi:hypothetical protein [Haliangium ochraceum]|uniref:TPR repeat-containing protein n=1 Tax=Haliangium ochraceum (strain DSM 14365 / JCM 11303 / SMP-2) TaxID=502025 RepID=D0LQ79_HALO1|nr:hypothetical protein [Haliangium ochraceum]ACY18888.1 TPR repeat-containing protein [Haliangium ochraceum DSM 14365]
MPPSSSRNRASHGAPLRRSALVALVCAALGAGSATAQAQSAASAEDRDAEAIAAAQTLFNEGMALYEAESYEAACAKFEASLEQFQGIGTRGKLAECYEQLGRVASAWRAYRAVAEQAVQAGDRRRARIAAQRAEALAARLPRLTVALAGDTPGLIVEYQGERIAASALGSVRVVDPGAYEIVARAPGYETWQQRGSLAESDERTVTIPRLRARPSDSDSDGDAPMDATAADGDAAGSVLRWIGLGVVAAGAVTVGFGVGSAVQAASLRDQTVDDGDCVDNACNSAGLARIEDARGKARQANLLLGVGGALAVGGALLWWLSPEPAAEGAERGDRGLSLRWAPRVGPETLGLSVRGRF